MPTRFKRILPSVIRDFEGGAGGLTSYADYAAVAAVKNAPPENPHFFSIDYDLPYYGVGSCKGMILDNRISLFDFLPMQLFDTSFASPSSLANTGLTISNDADGILTITKTGGNSTIKNNFIVGSTSIDFGQLIEYEVSHIDTSASGDRLFGIGVSLDGVAPIESTSGHFAATTLYRWNNAWNIYAACLTGGVYSGPGLAGIAGSSANGRYSAGAVLRMEVRPLSPYTSSQSCSFGIQEDGIAKSEVTPTNISASLVPAFTKDIRVGIYMYSYANQTSETKLLRIRVRDMPEFFSQPSYPSIP